MFNADKKTGRGTGDSTWKGFVLPLLFIVYTVTIAALFSNVFDNLHPSQAELEARAQEAISHMPYSVVNADRENSALPRMPYTVINTHRENLVLAKPSKVRDERLAEIDDAMADGKISNSEFMQINQNIEAMSEQTSKKKLLAALNTNHQKEGISK